MSTRPTYPHFGFNFEVSFTRENIGAAAGGPVALCAGSFSEITGLEVVMQAKTIREGGRNYGGHQRVGPVDFGTVVLKRGVTDSRDAWRWFELVNLSASAAYRLTVSIRMLNVHGQRVLKWKLVRALPVKFKMSDLNGHRGNEVAIEELHLVHEGLELEEPAP